MAAPCSWVFVTGSDRARVHAKTPAGVFFVLRCNALRRLK
jgi:hypothetical protein